MSARRTRDQAGRQHIIFAHDFYGSAAAMIAAIAQWAHTGRAPDSIDEETSTQQ